MGRKVETMCPNCKARRNKIENDLMIDEVGTYKFYNKLMDETIFNVKCPCCNTKYTELFECVYIFKEAKAIIALFDIYTYIENNEKYDNIRKQYPDYRYYVVNNIDQFYEAILFVDKYRFHSYDTLVAYKYYQLMEYNNKSEEMYTDIYYDFNEDNTGELVRLNGSRRVIPFDENDYKKMSVRYQYRFKKKKNVFSTIDAFDYLVSPREDRTKEYFVAMDEGGMFYLVSLRGHSSYTVGYPYICYKNDLYGNIVDIKRLVLCKMIEVDLSKYSYSSARIYTILSKYEDIKLLPKNSYFPRKNVELFDLILQNKDKKIKELINDINVFINPDNLIFNNDRSKLYLYAFLEERKGLTKVSLSNVLSLVINNSNKYSGISLVRGDRAINVESTYLINILCDLFMNTIGIRNGLSKFDSNFISLFPKDILDILELYYDKHKSYNDISKMYKLKNIEQMIHSYKYTYLGNGGYKVMLDTFKK